jgi:NADPH:quinone reductase
MSGFRLRRSGGAHVEAGAFRVGEHAGLPLHRFGLEEASTAHAAVESGAVRKVLITVAGG